MTAANEIMDLASEWAQETKDFGHLAESPPRDDLRKAVEAFVADAARYRAIRDGITVDPDNSGIVVSLIDDFGGSTLRGDHADAAIDAALRAYLDDKRFNAGTPT